MFPALLGVPLWGLLPPDGRASFAPWRRSAACFVAPLDVEAPQQGRRLWWWRQWCRAVRPVDDDLNVHIFTVLSRVGLTGGAAYPKYLFCLPPTVCPQSS